ncbi:MAG: RnfABCDGE type electron transport complex subunit D, partial [Candidatus Omnitrophota bacterium]
MRNLTDVTSSPHIHCGRTVKGAMWAVCAALIPAGLWGIWAFGVKALYLICASIISCVLTEAAVLRLRKRPVTIEDGSAVLTGLLLAYNVSPCVPV